MPRMPAARRGVALAGSARNRFAAVPATAALLLGAAAGCGMGSETATRAFQSLGQDTTAPVVRIRSPLSGSSFAVGASVPIVVVADDGMGVIAALDVTMSSGSGAQQIYHCSVTGAANVSCAFTLPA